jgi:imidazolonepropionase-like amidohydrolase
LVSLKWPERAKDADPALDDPLRTLEFRDKAPSTPAALVKAKIQFAFYSDGLNNPKDLRKALKKALDAGLTKDEAIRALTLSPAEIYGVADRLGSIDAGKIANLVVTDGDWFEEKTKVKYVFVDGTRFEPLPEEPKKPGDAKPTDVKPAEASNDY